MIIDSPLIQEILCEELQNAILGILQDKFGQLPVDLADRLRGIQDKEFLRSLVRFAGVCTSLDAFRGRLPTDGTAPAQGE